MTTHRTRLGRRYCARKCDTALMGAAAAGEPVQGGTILMFIKRFRVSANSRRQRCSVRDGWIVLLAVFCT